MLATEISQTMENYKLMIISPIYHSSLNHRFAFNSSDNISIADIIKKNKRRGIFKNTN